MKQTQTALDQIERSTLGHYETHAEDFWLGTRNHDVSQNIRAFLGAMASNEVLDILDLGCGPGRDLISFRKLGHRVTGLDGSEAFCAMARRHSACAVLQQSFLSLDLGHRRFDGIFANASLFHVPSQELPRVLRTCHAALRDGGILFTSNPRGDSEGWQGQRYGNYMEFDVFAAYLAEAGFTIVEHYYRPEGKPRHQQAWLAIVCQLAHPLDPAPTHAEER